MEKQATKKIMTISFLSAAVITYVVINVLFKSFAGAFGPVQKLYSVDAISHGLPILLAAIVFAVLQFNPRIIAWAEDVIIEVSKVVWPSQKDTVSMTLVVCVFVVISSGLMWIIDNFSRVLVQFILR